MIPTIFEDEDNDGIDWSLLGQSQQTPAAPPAPPEKKARPLPSFHMPQRIYRRDGSYEEVPRTA